MVHDIQNNQRYMCNRQKRLIWISDSLPDEFLSGMEAGFFLPQKRLCSNITYYGWLVIGHHSTPVHSIINNGMMIRDEYVSNGEVFF